jgi:hypothetical protein
MGLELGLISWKEDEREAEGVSNRALKKIFVSEREEVKIGCRQRCRRALCDLFVLLS